MYLAIGLKGKKKAESLFFMPFWTHGALGKALLNMNNMKQSRIRVKEKNKVQEHL
jgi:hypothetical protein